MTQVTQLSLLGQPRRVGDVTLPKPTARRGDIATSHEAAARAAFTASHDQLVVLRALSEHVHLTDFDLERITNIKQTSAGKRRLELMRAKPWPLAEMATDDRGQPIKLPVKPGEPSNATAWRITAAGHQYLKEHHG